MKPKCFGKILTLSYQERAENCCNDCRVQTECTTKAINWQKLINKYEDAAYLYVNIRCSDGGKWHTALSNEHLMACLNENNDGRYELRITESDLHVQN